MRTWSVAEELRNLCVQIAAQQAAVGSGTERHKKKQPAVATRVTAGSSEVTPVSETELAAGRRAKNQPAGAMDGPAGVKKWRG